MTDLVCAGCGAVLTGGACKLKCRKCNYQESCSDLLPALTSERLQSVEPENPPAKKIGGSGWDQAMLERIYYGLD